MSFMNVDLPAPFGPRSPVMPGGTDTETSFRPDTWPYHFDRCSVGDDAHFDHLDAADAPLEHQHRQRR